MHVVVTGGLGHIGSGLIRSSALRGFVERVTVVDDFSSQRYCSLFDLPSDRQIRFREADVRSLEARDLDGASVVVHLAAQTDATASVDQRDRVFANNLGATMKTIRLAEDLGARIVFASTTSVYGSQESRVDEDCPELHPQSPYAECKLREESALEAAAKSGLDVVVLRLGTIVGPSPGMRFHTAVNKFCLQARLGQPLTVWRTAWRQMRPYLAIDDACRALSWAASQDCPAAGGRATLFNVVTENATVEGIVDMVRGSFGPVDVTFTDSRIMNQLSYEVSMARMEAAGFSCEGSISSAIEETARLLSGLAPAFH